MQEHVLADLIAIGYDDETSAAAAAEEIDLRAGSLAIEPDAVAVMARAGDGRYRVTTNHDPVRGSATSARFWERLFGGLFFVPAAADAPAVDREFQDQLRDTVQPGTSVLFLVVDKVTREKTVARLSRFGGTVMRSSLSNAMAHQVRDSVQGGTAPA